MATQTFAGPVVLARVDNAGGQGSYILDTLLASADVDLTNTATSPTAVTNPITGLPVAYIARGVFFDAAGTFKFATSNGSVDQWTVLAGIEYPLEVAFVYKTGTSATGVHVLV